MLRFSRQPQNESHSDEQLLSAYMAGGDTRLLGALYERYMPMVYGVCLKILRDPSLAEDAVIGIYEEVVRKLKDHEVGAFRGWLYVLARNYCLMEWRKKQRKPTDYHAPENMERYDAVEAAFEWEFPQPDREAALRKCLETLQQLQMRCVTLFYFEDKSYKEIADMLSEELGKVRSHIQNGRRNLKICLDKTANT